MLLELQKLVGFYVYSHAQYWELDSGYYYSRTSDCQIKESEINKLVKIGDIIDLELVTANGLKGIHSDDMREMEVWIPHPTTGFFIYSTYWEDFNGDLFNVWFNHTRHRNELINNITFIKCNQLYCFYSYITICEMKFYIVNPILANNNKNSHKYKLKKLFEKEGSFYCSCSCVWDDIPEFFEKLESNVLCIIDEE
jgi:hypothetical protein